MIKRIAQHKLCASGSVWCAHIVWANSQVMIAYALWMRDECAPCSTLSANWPSEFNWKTIFLASKVNIYLQCFNWHSVNWRRQSTTDGPNTHKNPNRHLIFVTINAIQFHFALQSKVHFLLRNLWNKCFRTKSSLRIDFCFFFPSFVCDEKHILRIFLAEQHSVSVLFVSIVVFYQQPSSSTTKLRFAIILRDSKCDRFDRIFRTVEQSRIVELHYINEIWNRFRW